MNKIDNIMNYNDLVKYNRTNGFGDEVKKRILIGNFVLSKLNIDNYYNKSMEIREELKHELNEIFNEVDYLLYPTVVSKPKPLSYKKNMLETYSNDIMNLPASLAGLPSISIPISKKDNFPISIQIVGKYFNDKNLIQNSKILNKSIKI